MEHMGVVVDEKWSASDWTEGSERGSVYTECQNVKLFS